MALAEAAMSTLKMIKRIIIIKKSSNGALLMGLSATNSASSRLSASLRQKRFIGLWGWPIVLGLLMASGLVSALVSDGLGDVWSWFGLGIPVLVMAWFGFSRRDTP